MQVVIGDHEGIVQVFSVAKNQEIAHTFKTLPGQPISRIELGGALGTVKDKIFAGELRFWVRHIHTSFEISYILELSVNEVDLTSGDFFRCLPIARAAGNDRSVKSAAPRLLKPEASL